MHRRVVILVSVALLGVSACTSSDSSSDAEGDETDTTTDTAAIAAADDPSATAAATDPAQSGDDVAASPGSVDDFCAAISAIQSADFELEETFGPEARVLFDDVQSAAPPEVASDVSVVVGALDALAELGISTDENDPIAVEAASEILLDPAFSEANANLVAYTSEACDIELDAGDADADFDADVDVDGDVDAGDLEGIDEVSFRP
ncbi:MAG: hypothetical protein WA964_06085 [Ilumatobacter sp.]|uniref:hypothetical protein n=1 Tax=Ilumatobacter sp. TaxID=1967498 RepID=UPI003C7566F1